ncbi:hypothetical protein CEXT_608811 [Caerostris extrusa]|uniref:Uncharacterized protein n=1 Tax=Caerostris extrusa TaxID=172846 RepID=A0AAV4TZ87_CAEEX|nr:hypothetical protein CEXT_608811 [Caerostris extrusa]
MSSPIQRTHNKILRILKNPAKDRKISDRINAKNPKIRSSANGDNFVATAFDQKTVFLMYKYLQNPGVFNMDVTFSFWNLKSSHGIYEWEISRQ